MLVVCRECKTHIELFFVCVQRHLDNEAALVAVLHILHPWVWHWVAI